jgi:hypothetical protein
MDKVQAEAVKWLWPGRIPLGKITILQGDPGLGKSTITLDIAARLTRGNSMPDGSPSDLPEPSNVLLLSAEDGVADTLRPRLDALGADQARISVPWDEHEHLSIPSDTGLIGRAIEQVGARLIVIDPLAAFLDANINSWSNQQVRRALGPLKGLAERHSTAVLCVDHLNKRSGIAAVHRGNGSMGFSAAARSVLMAGKRPNEDGEFVLAGVKTNLAARPASLAYRTVQAANGSVCIEWLGECAVTADELGGVSPDIASLSKAKEAEDFILARIGSASVLARVLEKECLANGISQRTYKRARKSLGVVAKPAGFSGEWILSLPTRLALAAQRVPNLPESAK